MKKSDGNTDFTVTVRVFKYKTDKKPLITVTMSDKNPDHEMVFCQSGGFFQIDRSQWCRPWWQSLTVWRCLFQWYLWKEIAASGFKLYGYTPEEYYQNKTNAFPSIVNGETGWTFWSGGTRASYPLNKEKEPKKRKGYYEVYFTGANATAIQGQEQTLYSDSSGCDRSWRSSFPRTSDSLWWRGLPWLPSRVVEALPTTEKRERLGYCGH